MSADEIRSQLKLSKKALTDYLSMGVLTPLPATADAETPLYYADEVAVIAEALKTCDKSIKRLNSLYDGVQKELLKTKYASRLLELNAEIKDKVTTDFIDAVALFMDKAFPKLNKCRAPFLSIKRDDFSWFERTVVQMKEGGMNHKSPQEYSADLHHEVEIIDTTSLLNCVTERDALIEERDELKKRISELEKQIEMLSPRTEEYLARNGYTRELSDVQLQGWKHTLNECATVGLLNGLMAGDLFEPGKWLTLLDVAQCSEDKIKSIRSIKPKNLRELKQLLGEYDLELGMDIVEINGKYYYK